MVRNNIDSCAPESGKGDDDDEGARIRVVQGYDMKSNDGDAMRSDEII